MRVKVTTPYEGIPRLKHGVWYYVVFVGITASAVIRLGKGNRVHLIHLSDDPDEQFTRKEMKQMMAEYTFGHVSELSEQEAREFIRKSKGECS